MKVEYLFDFKKVCQSAVYGETIYVKKSIWQWYQNTWPCIAKKNITELIEIKKLEIEIYD